MNCLGLIKNVSSGSIFIDGKDCTNITEKEKILFWKNTTAFIFQDYGIIEEESVAYNIIFSNNKSDKTMAKKYLKKVGLVEKTDSLASTLSGGEKQRLGIARALYKNAKIILADEPTASLDEKNRDIIITLLKQCVEEEVLVILATHDENLAKSCNRVISM